MKNITILIINLFLVSLVHAQDSNNPVDLKVSYFKPEKINKINEGHYLIDFGKAFFGTVELNSKQNQNDSLFLHLGEKLKNSSEIDRKPGATIRYRKSTLPSLKANKTVIIDMVPYKRNTTGDAIMLPDSIGTIIPFRYFEIENLKIPIEELTIKQKAIHYNFNDEASYFSSSNKVMNAIWDLCKHTIKATSFTGYYVDGDRERIPYEADAYINQLSHYSVDNDYTIARRTNEYFINNPTWPTEWLLHTVLLFHADYMYTGDLKPLKENYEGLKLKTLMDLENEEGLISSSSPKLNKELTSKLGFKKGDKKIADIIDWPPAQKDTGWKLATAEGERDGYEIVPVNTAVNAFYYYNLKLMAEIAGFLDKKEDVILFTKKAEKTKKAINTKFLDPTKGYYIDGESSTHASLHGNMLPLAFDLVPEDHVKTVTDFIKTRGMACSVYGAQYLLEGLYKYGEAQYASDLITETESDRSWWNMIQVGSTMAMEAWDVKYKPNTDWNHAWGTAPLNTISRYMWGIKPTTAGYKTAEIKPNLGDLTFTKIKVPTKRGAIYADYKVIDETEAIYNIEIPESINTTFIIPKNTKKSYLNGKKINKKETVISLVKGKNTIRINY
jgi:hypothetical protein